MDFLTTPEQRLKQYLWLVTDFCLARKSDKCETRHMDRNQLFRFIAFCHLTGRLYVSTEDGQVKAVVTAWADWVEHIEAKYEHGKLQFEWCEQHPGDCLFVGEVFGTAKHVKRIWEAAIAHNPALVACPYYTMRRGHLVKLSIGKLERMFRREHA